MLSRTAESVSPPRMRRTVSGEVGKGRHSLTRSRYFDFQCVDVVEITWGSRLKAVDIVRGNFQGAKDMA